MGLPQYLIGHFAPVGAPQCPKPMGQESPSRCQPIIVRTGCQPTPPDLALVQHVSKFVCEASYCSSSMM